MQKILVSLPDGLVKRMKTMIPHGHRSKVIGRLLEKEIDKREESLYRCACDVEKDNLLNSEMSDWDSTAGDGIDNEAW